MRKLDEKLIRRHKCVPVQERADLLKFSVDTKTSKQAIQFLSYLSQETNKQVLPLYTSSPSLESHIQHYLQGSNLAIRNTKDVLTTLIESLIHEAFLKNCSDVHFEPCQNYIQVRFRYCGQLLDVRKIDSEQADRLARFLKINARLDPNERHTPQDGQMSFFYQGTQIYGRLSCLPALHGESFVLRLFSEKQNKQFSLEALGLAHSPFFEDIVQKEQGLWLIVGCIGCGKTTTYYSFLSALSHLNRRIMSFENPIEQPTSNFLQMALHRHFDSKQLLRYLLRQSVDVVGIGEIRDKHLLNLAVNAALTGHCVLATLHASDLPSVIHRLEHLGYTKETHANFLNGLLLQQIKTLPCPHCKPNEPCNHCHGTRISGRKASFEWKLF